MDLEVVGRHALLFDDDAASAFVNSGDALVDWNSLQIDRYDVRNLLTDPPPSRRRGRGGVPDDLEEEINRERYLDLPSDSDRQDLEEMESHPETAGYHSVGFSYGNDDASSNMNNNDLVAETSGFTPPFPVPDYILQRVPPSEKLHQIIARTATFVSKHGGQSEIVLRVKQGDNPTFGFLMPSHDLHPYFRYLVDHPELLHSEHEANLQEEAKKPSDEKGNSKGVAESLSLLGSVYGSGEDEEEGDNHAKSRTDVSTNSGSDAVLLGSKKIDFPESKVDKDDSEPKTSILSNKAKKLKVKENALVIASESGRVNIVDERLNSSHAAGDKLINSTAGVEPDIIDPPSETKMLIDKLVEFVVRNGSLFESNLIEQDSKHGRFPFLVPSNPYHAYYLKAREAAQESKLNGKNSSSGKNESAVCEKDKRVHEKDLPGDMPPESDRKEKFKMVIGKSKEAQGTEPRETQRESGVTVDAASAAAILQAAIRGIKPSNLHIFPSGSSARDGSQKSGQSGSTEAPPNSIARAASIEADSSEAQLAQEKNRKAERLKRAKIFVAMLKGGVVPSKAGTSASRSSSMEPLVSGVSKSENDFDNVNGKEKREGSLAPADSDKPAMGKKPEMNYFGDENIGRLSNRKYRTRSEACEEDGKVDDEDDDINEGVERRKFKSKRHDEDREDENALESEKQQNSKRRRRDHSSDSVDSECKDVNEEDSFHRHRYDHALSDEYGHEKDKHRKGSRKKHRSHHSSHHHSKKSRSSRRDSPREDEYDKEERNERSRRKKHRSSREKHDSHRKDESEEEERNEKHRRKKHPSSRDKHGSPRADETDYEERKERRRRKKHRSSRDRHGSKKRHSSRDVSQSHDNLVNDIRGNHEGDEITKFSEESKGIIGNDRINRDDSVTSQQSALVSSQPAEPNADISDDLRAKIRAMLMANRL